MKRDGLDLTFLSYKTSYDTIQMIRIVILFKDDYFNLKSKTVIYSSLDLINERKQKLLMHSFKTQIGTLSLNAVLSVPLTRTNLLQGL